MGVEPAGPELVKMQIDPDGIGQFPVTSGCGPCFVLVHRE
jgi:hypothetical protein